MGGKQTRAAKRKCIESPKKVAGGLTRPGAPPKRVFTMIGGTSGGILGDILVHPDARGVEFNLIDHTSETIGPTVLQMSSIAGEHREVPPMKVNVTRSKLTSTDDSAISLAYNPESEVNVDLSEITAKLKDIEERDPTAFSVMLAGLPSGANEANVQPMIEILSALGRNATLQQQEEAVKNSNKVLDFLKPYVKPVAKFVADYIFTAVTGLPPTA
jgi:hypothetical protein